MSGRATLINFNMVAGRPPSRFVSPRLAWALSPVVVALPPGKKDPRTARTAHRLCSFKFLCADGNIRNKYAFISGWYSSGLESFDESSVYRPRVWGRPDDQAVEDLSKIQIGDQGGD